VSEEAAALRVQLRSRDRLLEKVWAALVVWEASEEPARVVVADLRRRGLMPGGPVILSSPLTG
jgi:hypothetical protein